nr:cell division protein [Halimeda borneensis]
MELKFLLIFNDLYQPFFKLGNKTAKQITNLPIFLSFFVMALSVLQISFETRNYSVLKNYPHFTNPQIINKFETLYLQFHDTNEERKIALAQKRKQVKSQLIQEHNKDEKLFIDFYKYLKTSTPSYPTIFHQIQNSKLKEDTINLYKSFEQIAPILVSEIKKEFEQKNKIEQIEVEPIQHLQIDFPYKNWTTQNETFNENKEKLLTSWEFDNSDLVIKDLKKEKNLDKAYLIIHQFLCQYENYLKAHEKEKEILVKNINIQNPEINWSKFFINLFNPVSKQTNTISEQTIPVSEQTIPVSEQTIPVSEQTIPVSEQTIPVSEQTIPVSEQTIPVSEQKEQIPSLHKSKFPIQIESVMERKMRKIREEKERKEREKKDKQYEKRLKKKEYEKKRNQIPRVFEKKMLYTPVKRYLAFPKIHESMTKLQRRLVFKLDNEMRKKILPEARKARGPKEHKLSGNPWQNQWKRHKKLFHSLQARLPLPYENINWLDPLESDYFNQIKKINDQIPRKIEGFQELNSQQLKPCCFVFPKSEHQYQKRKIKKIEFNEKEWNHLVSKINKLVVEDPPSKLWEVCTAPTYKIDKIALYPWKHRKQYVIGYSKNFNSLYKKILFDFLKLLVDHLNVRYYAQIVHALKQLQFHNIKHFPKFDVEWVHYPGEKPRALERKRRYFQVGEGVNPKIVYQKEFGVKLKSIEDRRTERYVNKIAPLKRDPLIFPLYMFQYKESKHILQSSESEFFSSLINPYAFFLEEEEGQHDVDTDENFLKWREKKNTETFDFYLDDFSAILKFKNENSYLDELIYAEDYLLETISDILKRNNLNSDFIEFLIGIELEEEETEEESEEDDEFEEEDENGASAATSLAFDFIKNRKKQRHLFFQNNQNLVEMKDIYKQKRKLDFSFLYETFLPNFKLFENENEILKNRNLEKIQNSTKNIETVFINEQEFSYFNKVRNFIEKFSKSRIQLLKESHGYFLNHSDKIRKPLLLPKIPHDVSSPALVIPKDNWKTKKYSYPFEVIDFKEFTPNISKKFDRTYQMLPFFSNFLKTETEIDFNETEDGEDRMEKFYNQLLTYIIKVYPDFLENTEDISTIFDDLFKDVILYELHKFDKKNKKNKKNEKNELPAIYQFLQRRQMSGYFFPDLENWPSQRKLQKNLAPLSQRNLPLSTDRLQAHSFRYQAHSIEGRQFFEFREKINNYSWSLLFFFSSGWVFVNIFKNVYKKYAKEIVESGIDFLERAGILDDVKWLKEELGMSNEQAYRGIRHQGKKFKNIIGLERKYIILQLSEMVWFLKTQPFRFFNFFRRQVPTYLKPKGFLFTGPPGTGKTLLVQALAGETGVPIVTQSGGLLQNPRLRGKGAQTLHKLFLRAREIAPCIIFIDEVDGIGSRRQFLPDGQGGYDAIEFLENHLHLPPQKIEKKIQRRFEFFDDSDPYWKEPEFTQTVQSTPIPIDVLQNMHSSRSARNEQVSILTQLLIELDGLHPLDNILVIGATNRVEILDPALMRPGRFQRILKFNLPDYNARINLLKLYTQSSKIGIEDISWDYFSKRTQDLSSADIASIVFASELTAIQLGQKHTFASLERGIDLITSFPSDPVMLRLQHIFVFLEKSICKFFAKNQFYFSSSSLISYSVKSREVSALQEISNILRNCYYNIGKMFIVFCLQLQPLASINLWERPKNFRFLFFTQKFNEFDEFEKKRFSRIEIEKRLLAFFGGKAGESLFIFLPLHKFSPEIFFQFDSTFLSFANSLEQSNFGIENEIQRAQSLLKLMVEKWYFYLEKIATEKFHPILEDVNLWEYREKEILLAQALVDEMIIDLDMRNRLSRNEQKYSYQTWWMKKVATQLNFSVQMGIGSEVDNLLWSRIYLSDPENSAQNIEWVAPDEYFHTLLRTPPFCMPWTQFLENGRFAISNLLLLQSFNTVFKTLRQFPEFIDFLADYFLRQKSIRETVFQAKISQFFDGQI